MVGYDKVGSEGLTGFVLGGRQNGDQRAIVDFANVLIYAKTLDEADRQAIEGYLDQSRTLILDGHLWSFFAAGDGRPDVYVGLLAFLAEGLTHRSLGQRPRSEDVTPLLAEGHIHSNGVAVE